MKWFDSLRMRPVLILLVVSIVLSGGTDTKAGFSFGAPVNIGLPPNGVHADLTPSISGDGLEVYFWSNRPGGFGNWDLWGSTRTSTEEVWLPATNLGARVNSAGIEALPCISADGLELYFSRGSQSTADLMVARRTTKIEPWNTPDKLGPVVNSSARDDSPRLTSDGLELFFISNRSGGRGLADIWVASRPTTTDNWSRPVNLSLVNSSAYDQWVTVSGDGLTLLFQSTRPGGEYGGLYISRRKSRDGPWPAPVYLGLPMDGSVYTLLSSVSADGTILYLSDHVNYAPRAGGGGSADMWQVPVIPVVDFNGDGIVESADMCMMVDYWGTDEPLYDIAPSPFGDGIVDVQDLIVLAEHLFEESGLVAHWKLDETIGDVAYDSAGVCDGVLNGVPTWQPAGGRVGGALSLDGVDNYIGTDFVLNPAEGSFSVFAWVKGGVPGQTVLSQMSGSNWLTVDAAGSLMTELTGSGRSGGPLLSQSVITDGTWHRIGLVWDGSQRTLYVDDVEAAQDTQDSLASSSCGLHIGTGKTMASGTHFCGLIDDIRIYNRAVSP